MRAATRCATFVRDVKSGRADFTQTVTVAPTARSKKTSSGSFEFARPNRFRFDYTKPFEQLIVADGQKVWIYDADLNQVRSRKLAQALGSRRRRCWPAASLDKRLRAGSSSPTRDGLHWVQATPKAEGRRVPVDARRLSRQGRWRRWRSSTASASVRLLQFQPVRGQRRPLPPRASGFMPPAGADVIEQ